MSATTIVDAVTYAGTRRILDQRHQAFRMFEPLLQSLEAKPSEVFARHLQVTDAVPLRGRAGRRSRPDPVGVRHRSDVSAETSPLSPPLALAPWACEAGLSERCPAFPGYRGQESERIASERISSRVA